MTDSCCSASSWRRMCKVRGPVAVDACGQGNRSKGTTSAEGWSGCSIVSEHDAQSPGGLPAAEGQAVRIGNFFRSAALWASRFASGEFSSFNTVAALVNAPALNKLGSLPS
jgi:hypothetical protein